MVPKDSSVKTIPETFDNRVGSSPIGTGADVIWRAVLKEYGKTYDDIKKAGGKVSFVTFQDQANLAKDGHLDVSSSVCLPARF